MTTTVHFLAQHWKQRFRGITKAFSMGSIQNTDGHDQAVTPDAGINEIRLRTYQAEMLEASLKDNIIVVQDTGSGKTHMCVAL